MSHEKQGKSNEWYTPKYIFDALDVVFDLDVASPVNRKYCSVPAKNFITENSLDMEWHGFIWMNPPFGNGNNYKLKWIKKFINHANGIALFPDRTSAPWWQHFNKNCDARLFVDGKIKFINESGQIGESPSNGTTLFAIGSQAIDGLINAVNNKLGTL